MYVHIFSSSHHSVSNIDEENFWNNFTKQEAVGNKNIF